MLLWGSVPGLVVPFMKLGKNHIWTHLGKTLKKEEEEEKEKNDR